MSWISGVVDTVKNAFNAYLNQRQSCQLLWLSHDIFVDKIFSYLLIDDLLALRKVSPLLPVINTQKSELTVT